MNKMLTAAHDYIGRKFSIIPIKIVPGKKTGKNDKKPVVEWKKYQTEFPTEQELELWWGNGSINQIGIVTGTISKLAIIDIDDFEKANPIMNTLIPDSLEIPTVQTPRGGHHLYFRCTDDDLRNDEGTIPGADLRANGGFIVAPPTTGYNWIIEPNGHFPDLPKAYVDYIKSHENKRNARAVINTNLKYFDEGRRDSDLFTIANNLIKGNINPDFVKETLRRIVLSWGENDETWVQQKIDSALNRDEKKHENLTDEIKDFIENVTGEFNIIDLDRELGIMSKSLKNNRRVILHRFMKEDYIEKIGKRTGNYRKIERKDNEIIWQKANTMDSIDLKLPFDIDELVYIFPKNIIVIAGEKDAGKTAFLLNILRDNMHNHEILYLSSEMMEIEMASRLSKFDGITVDEWKFKALECSDNFQDYIKPDAINLIDYLEVSDEFWKVNEKIRKIYDKLTTGIAVIGIQKKKGSEYARGGEFSMEKARLYITLQAGNPEKYSELKIVSAKNPRQEKPPRGTIIEYRLVQGCKFIEEPPPPKPLIDRYSNESRQYKG